MQHSPRSVLVVEDNRSVGDVLEALFDMHGFGVTRAVDGETALDFARRLLPSLITLDLSLPGLGGVEVLRQLKASRKTRHIPVAVISADTATLTPADRALATAVFDKPIGDIGALVTAAMAAIPASRPASA